MRCPYCNGLNAERSTVCSNCGRDLTKPGVLLHQQSKETRSAPPYPQQQSPLYPPMPRPPAASPTPGHQPPAQPQRTRGTSVPPPLSPVQQAAQRQVAPAAQEPPAPFPSRTLAQLMALEPGALSYAVMSESVAEGRKRIVRITYQACSHWQQVATLLKAFNEQQADKFETIIIQGIVNTLAIPYNFNNGQLRFDRNTRLGSLLLNRYIIETGTGLENDAQRIVLQDVRS